jgi:hypothetical protein
VGSNRLRESGEERQQHAQQIRDWLAPWNLAIANKSGSKTFRLDAPFKDSTHAAYELREHGNLKNKITKWDKVKQVLMSPNLIDATDVLRKRIGSRR